MRSSLTLLPLLLSLTSSLQVLWPTSLANSCSGSDALLGQTDGMATPVSLNHQGALLCSVESSHSLEARFERLQREVQLFRTLPSTGSQLASHASEVRLALSTIELTVLQHDVAAVVASGSKNWAAQRHWLRGQCMHSAAGCLR